MSQSDQSLNTDYADNPATAINTYFSSRTEALSGILFSHLPDAQQRHANPFATTHIVVPNSGMQRYLELHIAEHFGICTHVEMSFASRFLKARYQQVLPQQNAQQYLDTRQLTFTILTFWAKYNPLPDAFAQTPLPTLLQHYNSAKQRYHLAQHIATLFAQYVNERPELISAWQRGVTRHSDTNVHEVWQMQLFNALHLGRFSGTDVQRQFHTALAHGDHDIPDVHLFGFHAMPPVQLADFAALSSHANVYAYIFNPSVAYWRDIVPAALHAQTALTAESEAALMTVGNPLLATWGQSGKYLIEQLSESVHTPTHVDELLQTANPLPMDSVLTWVQANIRDWGDADICPPSVSETLHPVADREIDNADFSLSLHAGASPRREVEILYDHLCQLFADHALNPSDILVMVPNLRDYAPHIQSIFGADTTHTIPFSLANQTAAEADPQTQAFLALLALINSDFSAQSLCDVISEVHIREAFHLSLADVETIRYWLSESRYAQHYHDDSQGRAGSLEKLLDALLLACVGGDDCLVDNGDVQRAALPAYQSSQRDSLLSFCRLLSQLSRFTRIKYRQQSLTDWRDTLIGLAHDFLGDNTSLSQRLQQWHDSVLSQQYTEQLSVAVGKARFDYDTVTADIIALLENEELHGPFLSGGISFCAMVPMRSIPAKMICLLGLNQSFPRLIAKDPLDLRHAKPLWSDRDINKEYKYFFLETLMAARERLYLSHVGKDDKTGEPIPPSVMVDELFAFIERHHADYARAAQHSYPLQGFLNTGKTTYQALYRAPQKQLQPQPQSQPQQHIHQHSDALSNISDTATETATPTLPTQMHATRIADALCEPLSLYVRHYLSATAIELPDTALAEHDMVALDSGLDTWHYKDALVQSAVFSDTAHRHGTLDNDANHDSYGDAIAGLIQQNRYPPEAISQPLLQKTQADIAPLILALQPWVDAGYQSQSRFINGRFNDADVHLLWDSPHVDTQGQWWYSAGANTVKKTLRLWVNHLLQQQVAGLQNYHSHLLTLDKGHVTHTTFTPLDNVGVAETALAQVLACFAHVFETPYAAVLKEAGKKSDEYLHYVAHDYPLYPRLAAHARYDADSALNDYFAPIDELLSQHLTTTWGQS